MLWPPKSPPKSPPLAVRTPAAGRTLFSMLPGAEGSGCCADRLGSLGASGPSAPLRLRTRDPELSSEERGRLPTVACDVCLSGFRVPRSFNRFIENIMKRRRMDSVTPFHSFHSTKQGPRPLRRDAGPHFMGFLRPRHQYCLEAAVPKVLALTCRSAPQPIAQSQAQRCHTVCESGPLFRP